MILETLTFMASFLTSWVSRVYSGMSWIFLEVNGFLV